MRKFTKNVCLAKVQGGNTLLISVIAILPLVSTLSPIYLFGKGGGIHSKGGSN